MKVDAKVLSQVESILKADHISYKTAELHDQNLIVRFFDTDTQLKAKDIIKATLGDNYTAALNLAPATPHWLSAIGAEPMKLGLDLRGGIYLSLDVDLDAVLKQRSEGMVRNIGTGLREADIRYTDIIKKPTVC